MQRYNSVAVSLHWLIALMIAGLIVLAKISHNLSDDDPLRFELIQWHKSFGISVLLLVVFRIAWRLTHRPPALPESVRKLERFGASAAHVALYGLMLALPITGWAMVSASPLNLATELFGLIPWPHLPWLTTITDKEVWAHRFHDVHHLLGNGLMLLVLLHALAALRHHFLLKDGVLSRMTIRGNQENQYGLFLGVLVAGAGGIALLNLLDNNQQQVRPTAPAGIEEQAAVVNQSLVGFSASQMGDPIVGVFKLHKITLEIDNANLESASLQAQVETASVDTGDGQIDATVVTADWFASKEFPLAEFASSSITSTGEGQYRVAGTMTIRNVSNDIEFDMSQSGNQYRGEFTIDRTDFGIGVGGQDEFVAPDVTISFEVSK